MTNAILRIKKIENSLTPKQAVIKWLNEAHQYPSMRDYLTSLRGRPETAFPMYLLPDQVEKAVHARMKGRSEEEAVREMRQAVRDAIFLFHLHQQANSKLMGEHNEKLFCLMWLRAELRWLRYQHDLGETISGSWKGKQTKSKGELRFGASEWKASAERLLQELYMHREAIALVNSTYFSGHDVLFPEVTEEFRDILGKAELLADMYNTSIVLADKESTAARRRRLPKGLIDMAALEAEAQRLSAPLAGYMVDMAKAEALDYMGDNRAAVAVIEPHIWPDQGPEIRTRCGNRAGAHCGTLALSLASQTRNGSIVPGLYNSRSPT